MAKAVVRGSLISIGLVGALLASIVQAAGDSYVVPGSKAAQLENCVEPTDFMRRNHMEVIQHQRDETVHNGIRSTQHSLAGCIECHVSYEAESTPVPVDSEGQFCETCHNFAAVGVNCFGCHATVPALTDREAAAEVASRADLGWHPPITMSTPAVQGLQPETGGEGR
ncbi:MAG: sulfur reduction protein DsrJ [Pseudomonadota bacterium]|nr:sulfur reduction protein DsrJ [Pseudomonadota bacterium]